MTDQLAIDERQLSAPISAEGDTAYQVLANEQAKRVFTVIVNMIEVRGRAHADGVLDDIEVKALLMGAVSGIAMVVARMQLASASEDADALPPEVLLLNDLANQFIAVIEQMRETDPVAMGLSAKPSEETPVH